MYDQVGYIERFGTGTLEIIRLSEAAHLNQPDFNIDEGFKVVLWRPLMKPDKQSSTGQVPDKYRTSSSEIQRLVWVIEGEMKSVEIQQTLELKHRETFRDNYLLPSIEAGFVEMTEPDSPNSPRQRYRLTGNGLALKKSLET